MRGIASEKKQETKKKFKKIKIFNLYALLVVALKSNLS
jgi:hypothetical protein